MSAQAITVTCDVLVAGSGAAGFATALTAQLQGLDVIMVEKAPLFGGTTAYSAGVVWIPVNAVQRAAGLADSRQSALDYLAHHVGNRLDQARAEAFLDGILGSFNRAPTTLAMVGLQATTRRPCSTASHARGLPSFRRCRPGPTITPTSRAPAGAADHLGRRSLTAGSGERFSQAARADQDHGGVWRHDDRPQRSALHFQMSRSLKAAVHVGGMVMRFARDRLTYPRGTRLVNGNALIARMAAATHCPRHTALAVSPIVELRQTGGRIVGAVVDKEGKAVEVTARLGVVLAGGGFPGNDDLTRRLYPHRRR